MEKGKAGEQIWLYREKIGNEQSVVEERKFWETFEWPHRLRTGAEKRNSAGGRPYYQIVRYT